jgi:N-acetylglucosaminyl-diphospho-decaprenol L-rhamnosyltransferase
MTRVAVMTVASASRFGHLQTQRGVLRDVAPADLDILRIEAWLDPEPPLRATHGPRSGADATVHVPPGASGMRVGAARNAVADVALREGADVLVFLDVDCLPGPDLLSRYVDAAQRHPDALLAGPVTYLPSIQRPSRADELGAMTRPHPARPSPSDGTTEQADPDAYDLFWSLSFAVTPATWQRLDGFSDDYEGYGAEDTDLAWRARERGIPLRWVGGAHAYHQWHPTSSPPWAHLDDILRNGRIFAERWGTWPMRGWLDAFARAGAIVAHDGGWVRAGASSAT